MFSITAMPIYRCTFISTVLICQKFIFLIRLGSLRACLVVQMIKDMQYLRKRKRYDVLNSFDKLKYFINFAIGKETIGYGYY